jgi:ABC-2 type transport system permease protein
MSLVALLRKEFHWSKRNVLLLVFLLVVIPFFFAGTSFLFQDVVPRNVPVAVVAEDDSVTEQELEFVEATLDSFTNPTVVETQTDADRQLERESVYGIVTVPPDISEQGANVTATWTIDGTIAPFQSPSEVLGNLMGFHLDRVFDANVAVEKETRFGVRDLPEHLFPTVLLTLVIFFAFTYVPYMLRRERTVLDRVRVEASLESLVLAKISFLTVLMLAPILVFHGAAQYYGYDVASMHPGGVGVLLLTFFLLSTVSTTVMVLTRFSTVGTFANLVVMLGLLALSGLAFPRGFFSPLRTAIVQMLPTHYAILIVRSFMLKDASLTLFFDWIAGLVGLTVLALLVLKLAIVHYRRTT